MPPRQKIVWLAAVAVLLGGCRSPHVTWQPPAYGPGSARYPYRSYTFHRSGYKPTDYALYAPAGPVPGHAPVVVFLHGWGALDPDEYSAWLVHLARRGNIVICPRWQDHRFDANGQTFLPDAVTAVKAALARLEKSGPVRPETSHFAVFGHSIGATLAADMAALAPELGLPHARAVFCITPGSLSAGSRLQIENDVTIADFSHIPRETLLVVMVGQEDDRVGAVMADTIYGDAQGVAPANKSYVTVRSDLHGAPPLVADHKFCLGRVRRPGRLNALDYYAVWKTGDALLDAGFRGTNRDYALGNTPRQRYMGQWPDGTPVRELHVRQD